MQNLNNTTFGDLARDNILKYLLATDTVHEVKANLVETETEEKYIEIQAITKTGELLNSEKIFLGSNLVIEEKESGGTKILNALNNGGSSYTAGDGIAISNDEISVDDTIARIADIPAAITINTTSGQEAISDGTNTLNFKANAFTNTVIPTEASQIGAQATLTVNSVADGTLDKTIGFDINGTLIKGIAGGGSISYVEITE